jgi:hypothetical protein
MIFTPDQINELLKVLERMHLTFTAEHVGVDVLSEDDKQKLRGYGIDVAQFSGVGKIEHSYKFGMLAEALGSDQTKNMSYAAFKKFLASGKFFPLTIAEQAALDQLKYQAFSEITGLGNRIGKDFRNVFVEVDKKQRIRYEKLIRSTSEEALAKRWTAKQLATELGQRSGDWARDFDRMADYIMHDAFDRGKAQVILKKEGSDAKVWKKVYHGACKHCQALWLTAGIGSKPLIYKLSTLISNGSNVGAKTNDWKPTLGPTHPWCRCELHDVPAGFEWDAETQDFTKPIRDTKGVKRKSKPK